MGFKITQMQSFTDHNNSLNNKSADEDLTPLLFREALITLRLGALVVHLSNRDIQGIKSASDIQARLKRSINRHSTFSPEEKAQLHIYLLQRLKALENILEIKMELTRLVLSKKRRVRHILLSIIFANGYHTLAKQQHIEKLYLTLGLNKLMLEDDIKAFFSTNITPKNKKINIQTNVVTNDKKRLFDIKYAQKKRIKAPLLSEKVTANYKQQSLTNKRANLYDHLIKKEMYSQKEFNQLCQHYKLTANGAIEIINNWTYQQIGSPVLAKEENTILVNMDTVTKIQQKTAIPPKIHHLA